MHKLIARILSGLAALALAVAALPASAVSPAVPSLQIALTPTNTLSLSWQGFLPYEVQECSDLNAGAWTTLSNAPVESNAYDHELILPEPSGGRFFRLATDYVAEFDTHESAFSPYVDCAATAPEAFWWTWSDGTSDTNWPIALKDFGWTEQRAQCLAVLPAGAITTINLGFDGSDAGWTNVLAEWPAQGVFGVHFTRPLTNLQFWASSYNPLTSLDFTGFTSLQSIDCYRCTMLSQVSVANLPALRRVCFEGCSLLALDLSGDANLEEVRAAENLYTSIEVAGGVGPNIWHWCTRDNALTQQFSDVMTNFYSLQDLYIWNNNQSGLLQLVSTNLLDVAAYSNAYTCADLAGHTNLAWCDLANNSLTNLILDDCVSLQHVNVAGNLLPASVLNRILCQLDTNAPALMYLNLSLNAELPTEAGFEHYLSLINRGVEVLLETP